MIKQHLLSKNPLDSLAFETEKTGKTEIFGAVISRAGVGKTAFLVQIAISSMLKDKNVLHVSIKDPVEKVHLWYKEMFFNLAGSHDAKKSRELWENLLTRRFIMTFETENFDFTKLTSRIDELQSQQIFSPEVIIIDGLSSDEPVGMELSRLKEHAARRGFTLWFSVRAHRHQTEIPLAILHHLCGGEANILFDMVIQLLPEKDMIRVKRISTGQAALQHPALYLDPSTMMVKENMAG